jgi:hypothetical protein
MTNDEKIAEYVNVFDPTIVKIVKTKQAGLYVKHNLEPIDVFYNDGALVHVFNKAETNSIYTKWLNKTLL